MSFYVILYLSATLTDNFTKHFFFEEIKMEYINKGDVISSVQDVTPRTPLPTKSHTRYIQDYGQSRPKHRIGSDHQL